MRKGEPKATQTEYLRRIRTIQEWMLIGYNSSDIKEQALLKFAPISTRQVERYIKEAHDNFEEITEKKIKRRLNYHIEARMKVFRELQNKNTPAGAAVALKILEDVGKLEKLYVTKVEHSGDPENPIQMATKHTVVFKDMSKKSDAAGK